MRTIPGDLQQLYIYASMPGADQFAEECVKLIERIADSEQQRARLTREKEALRELLKEWRGTSHHEGTTSLFDLRCNLCRRTDAALAAESTQGTEG